MKTYRILGSLVVGSLLSTAAFAQPHDLRRDHRGHVQDRRESRDDRRDAKVIAQLLQRFDKARATRNFQALRHIDTELKREIEMEIEESRRELRQERREADRTVHDARHNPNGWTVPAASRKDVREAVRDVRQEEWELKKKEQLGHALSKLYGRMDQRSLNEKRAILVEMNRLARGELREHMDQGRRDPHRR